MVSKEQKLLAEYIKGVHQSLRLRSKTLGPDQAWMEHCQQTETLQKYAESMQRLAEEFWQKNCESNDLCRIQWVLEQSVEYFHAGGIEKAVRKEYKLSQNSVENLSITADKTKLKLLDVGSCYNPFSKFPLFDVTAVDLMPAVPSVLKCDFLTVDISCSTISARSPTISLRKGYFDIVVFSLLLEYLPSPMQRFKCCEKAYNLLEPSGLLFILTPDSKHATANSKVMKSWRYSLASIGFLRVSYQKLKHLHCMAYRKCISFEATKRWLGKQCVDEHPEDLMHIPQDFHEYPDSSSLDVVIKERSENDDQMIADTFTCLPDSDIFL